MEAAIVYISSVRVCHARIVDVNVEIDQTVARDVEFCRRARTQIERLSSTGFVTGTRTATTH